MATKYTFIQKAKFGTYIPASDSKITYEIETDCLQELLDHMEYFIRGCSFMPKGKLMFIEEDCCDYEN